MIQFTTPPTPLSERRHFGRGVTIVAAGRPASTIFLVCEGQVRVYLLGESGRETVTAVLGPGQIFGIAPLLGRPTYHAFVEATTSVWVWAIPATQLLARLPADLALLHVVVESLARRLCLVQAIAGSVAVLPVGQRVPQVLSKLDECLGGEQPQLPQSLLAGLAGARPETISRMGISSTVAS